VVGKNEENEEVTSFDLAIVMKDLEVDLAPRLTKSSRSSPSTCAYFQVTHVITTRDTFEEFVAVEIWPSSEPLRWPKPQRKKNHQRWHLGLQLLLISGRKLLELTKGWRDEKLRLQKC
jgi:hypothetical protein